MIINRALAFDSLIVANVARMVSYGSACASGCGRSNFGTSATGFLARFPSSVVNRCESAVRRRKAAHPSSF